MGRGAWRATLHGVAETDSTERMCTNTSAGDFYFLPLCPSISWAPAHPWRSPSSSSPEILLLGFSCFPSSLEKSHSTRPSHAQQHITVESLPTHLPAPRSTKQTTLLPVRQSPSVCCPARVCSLDWILNLGREGLAQLSLTRMWQKYLWN